MIKDINVNDELRLRSKQITLSNQDIVELGYALKELIEPLIEHRTKLFFEQANCYLSCFQRIRQLLWNMDQEYLAVHQQLADFYLKERELSSDWDRLSWEPAPDLRPGESEPTPNRALLAVARARQGGVSVDTTS